jgi:predicted dehydrogenase
MSFHFSRRQFLATTGAAAATTLIPLSARALDANSKLRVASIGTGGKGKDDLQQVAASPRVEVVALCNVEQNVEHFGWAAAKFPKAKHYVDWRKLLEDEKEFDAVIVSTPDHMHAPIAMPAMALKKHVYCQKPLTHTVHEARQMRLAAEKAKIVSQMGNQIQSHAFYRTAVKLVHDGAIGKVKEVHSWQSGKLGWMLVDDRPGGADSIPETLNWDQWLGVAPERPYKSAIYAPFNWRAWQDFSSGQLGDFGCHILDPVFKALRLKSPTSIQAEAPELNKEVWTKWSKVSYQFPGSELIAGPSLSVTWYDGEGSMPPKDKLNLPEGTKLPSSGSVLIGEKGSLIIPHVAPPQLVGDAVAGIAFPMEEEKNHYTGWAHACLGDGETTSNFDYSGPLTETVLLGVAAIRLAGQKLDWDAAAAKVTNNAAANDLLTKSYRKGWEPSWV